MKIDILKQLLQAHADGDEPSFRRAAVQLASAESAAGHARVAEDLRAIIAKIPASAPRVAPVVDIASPRGDLSDLLDGGRRDERLTDIILPQQTRTVFERIIRENRSRARLERFNVQPTRRMFFHGPPGCGKTLAAAVLAGELGMALLTVRMDSLFSRFLGATAAHLRTIFSEMPRRPAVYFFDEFDAVAKSRGDAQDVGEMNRVVTAFLQLVDADRSPSVLVAATNHVQIVDRAALRRFDAIVEFDLPDARAIYDLLLLRLAPLGLRPTDAEQLAERGVGHNFADLARACDDSIRTMVLDDREQLRPSDVDAALHRLKTRLISSGR